MFESLRGISPEKGPAGRPHAPSPPAPQAGAEAFAQQRVEIEKAYRALEAQEAEFLRERERLNREVARLEAEVRRLRGVL